MITRRELLPALAAAIQKDRLAEAEKLIASSGVESAALLVRQGQAEHVFAHGRAKVETHF